MFKMNNSQKYVVRGTANTVILLFTTGGILQTFFSYVGMNPGQIGVYNSMNNIVQIMVMILGIIFVDQVSDVRRLVAKLSLSPVLFCFAMLFFCVFNNAPIKVIFLTALVLSAFQNLLGGFKNVLEYRLPYQIIQMETYEKLENVIGIAGGILSIAITVSISIFSTAVDFPLVMIGGFSVSILLCVLCSIVCQRMKAIKAMPKEDKFKVSKFGKFEFIYFYFPNFLRGCANGIVGMMPVICIYDISNNASVVSGMTVALSISAILGSALYRILGKRVKTTSVFMLGSLILFIALPLTLLGRIGAVFFAFYLIAGIGYSMVSISGAVYATEFIKAEDIGAFSSMRLIMISAGQAVSSYIIGILIGKIPSVLIIMIFGVCQLISGILHYCYKNKIPPGAEKIGDTCTATK